MPKRVCTLCLVAKPQAEYPRKGARCKPCFSAVNNAWNKANREKAREYRRRYNRNNPEKVAEWSQRHGALRAQRLKNASGGTFEPSRYVDRVLLYDKMCAYCGLEPANTLDHAIPVSRGGGNWPANIYPACFECNREKHIKILHKEWVPPWKR